MKFTLEWAQTGHSPGPLSCLIVSCITGVRLDWVTTGLEVLLPHGAAAAAQAAVTPILQPLGFSLQPSPVILGSSSLTQALPTRGHATAMQAADLHPASSSYDELIAASSSNPAALLGRLLENAPNLARLPSSRSSIGSTPPGSVGASPAQPTRFIKPTAAQQLPRLAPSLTSLPQKQQEPQTEVAINVAPQPDAATAAASASSRAAAAAGGLEGAAPDSYKFNIEGMSCGSCVASVQGAVGQVRFVVHDLLACGPSALFAYTQHCD